MRKAFTAPGSSIHYYETEWCSSRLSWADFRGNVLGGTDPKTAAQGSLRNTIYMDWQALNLKASPNTGDNGVHASASPFEALAERINWLGGRIDRDPFGKALLKSGISASTIKNWCKDPQVTFGPISMTKSLFDTLEDTDSDWCAALCQMIALSGTKQKDDPKEIEIKHLQQQLGSYKELADAVNVIHEFVPMVTKGKGKGKREEPKGKGKGKSKGKGKK